MYLTGTVSIHVQAVLDTVHFSKYTVGTASAHLRTVLAMRYINILQVRLGTVSESEDHSVFNVVNNQLQCAAIVM